MALPEHDASPRGGSGRILTVPNLITVARLACLPIYLVVLFGADDRSSAAYLLAVLGITDFADGYVARRFDQGSELGKVLDPVADRLLFLLGAGAILVDGSVPAWFAVAVLAREVLVSAATLALAAAGARRIDVTWAGKAGTFALMIAFPLFLGGHADDLGWDPLAEVLAWCAGIPGLALSWYAAAAYLPEARRALAEGRSGRTRVRSGP